MTITEKILARASGRREVRPGDYVLFRPDLIATTDVHAGPRWAPIFQQVGARRVFDPEKVVVCFDHMVPAPNQHAAELHRLSRQWARDQGIRTLYDVGQGGILHQVLPERGHVRPGMLIMVDDGNGATSGALGALVLAGAWNALPAYVFGQDWLRVPESLRFHVTGRFRPGVTPRDLMIKIAGEATERVVAVVVEFTGPTVETLDVDGRMTMCNVTAQMLAESAIMNPSPAVMAYVAARTTEPFEPVFSDPDAAYVDMLHYDVAALEPHVAAPHVPNNARPLVDVAGTRIDQAYVGACSSGRIEDLRIVAKILTGRKVHPGCRMIVAPGSVEVALRAVQEGLTEVLLTAGASLAPPGCGGCWGSGFGLLADGEVCITSSTENFKGRMGSHEADIYLASPASVAASAVTGHITDPRQFL